MSDNRVVGQPFDPKDRHKEVVVAQPKKPHETRTVTQEKVRCPGCEATGVVYCDGPSELGCGPYSCSLCDGNGYFWRNL